MMKKEYTTPVVEVMEMKANQLLMASGVSSDLGIGFGGVDDGGILDPAAPDLDSYFNTEDLDGFFD